MKKFFAVFAMAACACCVSRSGEIKFDESAEIFSNPGQGFACSSARYPENRITYGAGYKRFEWSRLQPSENTYDWSPIDKEIEYFSKIGLPFYFRIMCTNFHSSGKYSTPKWVFDKGAKYHEFKGVEYKTPDGEKSDVHISAYFDDPIFIEEHEKFIKALAARYDGDPHIGGIDLGSYGNWGEWHCVCLGLGKGVVRPHSLEIRRRYANMYLDNFRKSDLFFMTDDYETLGYVLGAGEKIRVGMRRDSIGSPWHFERWVDTPPYNKIKRIADVWKHKPIFFEFVDQANALHEKGWDIIYSCDWMLKYNVSLVHEIPLIPEQVKDKKELLALQKVERYAGARLVPEKARVECEGGTIKVRVEGVNKGVSKIYLPYEFAYELRDRAGNVVAEKISAKNPGSILPGKFVLSDEFKADLKGGETYFLSLRVRHIPKVFKDFRFASKNLTKDGALDLGNVKIK